MGQGAADSGGACYGEIEARHGKRRPGTDIEITANGKAAEKGSISVMDMKPGTAENRGHGNEDLAGLQKTAHKKLAL